MRKQATRWTSSSACSASTRRFIRWHSDAGLGCEQMAAEPSNANYNNPAYLDGVQSDNSIDFKNTASPPSAS